MDGRCPRCSDITMITKRSHHIPTLISSDSTQTSGTLRRTRRDQKNWVTTTLQNIITQNAQALGPVGSPRNIVYISIRSPPYQDRTYSQK